MIIVPPENVITQPDKEREALQSFKEQKVKINGYSLKTNLHSLNHNNIKHWVIEGSNDEKIYSDYDCLRVY